MMRRVFFGRWRRFVGIVFKLISLADFWGTGDRLRKDEEGVFPQMAQIV
jgi:hypothetical protein